MNKATSEALQIGHAPGRSCRYSVTLSLVALTLSLSVPSQATGQDILGDFVNQLLTVESVHLEANAVLKLSMDGVTRGGNGSFSYWEQGDWFRIRCETGDNLKLLGDMEWSYDGDNSLIWFKSENMIAENTSGDQSAVTAIPNPFFLAVGFLISDECLDCRVGFSSVLQWRSQMSETPAGPGKVSVENALFGRDYLVEVIQVDGMNVPSRISWVDTKFDGDAEILLSDYQRVGSILWPTSITKKWAGRSTDASSRVHYILTTLEMNETYAKDVFTLTGDDETFFFEPPGGL
jgi:hypothetical protein